MESLRVDTILSNKRITKALIRLRGCAGWSAPWLFANHRRQVFSGRGPYIRKTFYVTESEGKDTSHLHGDVLLKLDREFPGDVGGFAIYFLNIIKLNKGDAMYLEANLPHAYLSGGKFLVKMGHHAL